MEIIEIIYNLIDKIVDIINMVLETEIIKNIQIYDIIITIMVIRIIYVLIKGVKENG